MKTLGLLLGVIGAITCMGFSFWYIYEYAWILSYWEFRMVKIWEYWYIWLPGIVATVAGVYIYSDS